MSVRDFNKLLVHQGETLKMAMQQLDETSEKNLYVVDESCTLIGAISDGDIRRALLKGIGLEDVITVVMNKTPKFVYRTEPRKSKKIRQMMLEYDIAALPILDADRKIVEVVYWVDVFDSQRASEYGKKSNKVFVVAGGVGSRLEPFTKILPKPLVPIG